MTRYINDPIQRQAVHAYSRSHASGLQFEAVLFPRFCIRDDGVVTTRSHDSGRGCSLCIRHWSKRELILRSLRWGEGSVAVLVLLIRVRVVSVRRWRIRLLIWLLIWVLIGRRERIVLMRWRSYKARIDGRGTGRCRGLLDVVGWEEADF